MQKKLLAVAVAGVLAAPGVAFAQSSVTISGNFKVSLENIKLQQFNNSAPGTGRTAGGAPYRRGFAAKPVLQYRPQLC